METKKRNSHSIEIQKMNLVPVSTSKVKSKLSDLVQVIEFNLSDDKNELKHQKCIENALKQYVPDMKELEKYCQFDKDKPYTRNLIATDSKRYSLMLLCWNKGKCSPIHDHPCDGCWVKLIQGSVLEVRYKCENGKMVQTEELVLEGNDSVSFMHDSMGYHKVGNPSDSMDAITLHLYAPPFDQCRLWLDTEDASNSRKAQTCFYSEYGQRVRL